MVVALVVKVLPLISLLMLLMPRVISNPFETHYMEPQYDARDFEGRLVEVHQECKELALGNLV